MEHHIDIQESRVYCVCNQLAAPKMNKDRKPTLVRKAYRRNENRETKMTTTEEKKKKKNQ